MKIAYKTRGNTDPRGKEQVYFTAHPLDSSECFNRISEDILSRQNCALYYDAEPEKPYKEEELLEVLSGMKLFVIAVTSRFLYTPNRARETELPFAVRMHIPVLPLLEEPGLASEFDRICGNYQTLSRFGADDTAIPYIEKLTKYLNSVLVGEEMAEKIRAAFDAYVFLSYRKKDRKYANQLMHLVHSHPLCRDIAIWYDEFLVPGEDFNDSIADMMKRSDLFVLAVTPNLLEPNNYVMKTEYPAAKKQRTPILPVEMVPTKQNRLKKNYPGIPNCVKGEAVSEKMLQKLHDLAIREKPDDPMHNFFIGLAYLSGIDVEVDHEMALKLIKSAADADLPEAIRKLSQMYSSGLGVARDHEESVKWHRKLIELLRKEYERSGSRESAKEYAEELLGLAEYLNALLDTAGAEEALQKALTISDKAGDPMILSSIYSYLGNINKQKKDLAAARDYYERSLRLEQEIASGQEVPEEYRGVAVAFEKLGSICEEWGDLPAARNYYERSFEIFERIEKHTGTQEARHSLAISCNILGNLYLEESQYSAALRYFERAGKIMEGLAAETERYADYRVLSNIYILTGELLMREGKILDAFPILTKALKMTERLAAQTETAGALDILSVSYEKNGDLHRRTGNFPAAHEYYEKALQIREKLASQNNTAEQQRNLSVMIQKMGSLYQDEKNIPAAREYYKKSLMIDRELVSLADTTQALRGLSLSYGYLGNLYEMEGAFREARSYYESALEVFRKLADRTNTPGARLDLSICYEKLASTCMKEKNYSDARKYYENMVRIDETLLSANSSEEELQHLSTSLGVLGSLCESEGKLSDACGYYEKMQQICQLRVERTGSKESRDDLMRSRDLLNACRKKMKKGGFLGWLRR